MSRFSGPQHDGATRDLRALKREQAERRQADERERDRRRAERYARMPAIPLTDAEVEALYAAVARIEIDALLARLARLGVSR